MKKRLDAEKIVNEDNLSYKSRLKKIGRKRFIVQGAVSESSSSLSSSFIVPFARYLGANAAHIGFLSAFAGLIAPLGNIWGSKQMEKYSRKTIHIRYTLLQALIWLPIIALAFMFSGKIGLPYLPYLLILFYAFFIFFSSVKDPSSFSWLGDLVQEKERGHYFAKRNKVIGWAGVIVFLVGGAILYYFENKPYILSIYVAVFFIAIFLRFISLYQVKHIFSPRFVVHKRDGFSFWSFIKKYDNFTRFAIFYALFNFAVMLASPFFAVYMLKDLKLNIFAFTAVTLSSTIFYLLLTPLAGKFSDKYGNLKLIYISAWVFPITPLFWVFLKDPVWLFILPGFTAGLGNAALTIGATNFAYENVPPKNRALSFTYLGILNGVAIFFGSIIGGLIIEYIKINFINTILFVFIVSATLRFFVALVFLPFLSEGKKHERLRGLSWDVTHPFKTMHTDFVWFKKFISEK